MSSHRQMGFCVLIGDFFSHRHIYLPGTSINGYDIWLCVNIVAQRSCCLATSLWPTGIMHHLSTCGASIVFLYIGMYYQISSLKMVI